MRGMVLTGVSMTVGAVTGFFLVASGQLLGAFMGAVAGFVLSLMILAYPRDRDYPRQPDDTFL